MHAPIRALAALAILAAAPAALAETVTVPDESQTTTFTATVAEQITVTVPSDVAFTVDDVTVDTDADAQAAITITSMALLDGNHLSISIAPDAAEFTPPAVGGTTWASDALSWNAASGTAFTGTTGTMSGAADTYQVIGTCTAGVNACSTSDLTFTLAAKTDIDQAGAHALTATWKFESLTQ